MPKNKYNNNVISGFANDSYEGIKALYPDAKALNNPTVKENTLPASYKNDTKLTTETPKSVNIFTKIFTD